MTERKQIEEALKECEAKFLRVFCESPLALTLTSAIDYRYIEVNDTFEHITGWNRNEVIGRTPFDIGLWVDPSQRIDLVKRLLSGGTVRNLQFLVRTKKGDVLTALGSAALIEINGETCVLSLNADVTDLKRAGEAKQAEAALSDVARKLIQAHDEERTGIAQELRNYIERLVLLSIDLDRFQQNLPELVAEVSQQLGEARKKIEGVVLDIQSLSYRLHSSKLEFLGLAAAVSSFCKELSEKTGIGIDYSSDGISKELPQEVSLCVFRILQEALQNAVSHSGSQSLRVVLRGGPNELNLTVSDSGAGFDTQDALKGPGLGLIIMKERLKLVGGETSIHSQRGSGTTIHIRVPLSGKAESAEAVANK